MLRLWIPLWFFFFSFSPPGSDSPLVRLLCRVQMTQTRLKSTAVTIPVFSMTFLYSASLEIWSKMITDTRQGRGEKSAPHSQKVVYFKFPKGRRLKGVFEEVFNVPLMLRIGLGTAEEGELEILLATCSGGSRHVLKLCKLYRLVQHFPQ